MTAAARIVHGGNKRTDSDGLEGGFVKFVSGPNNGKIGVLDHSLTFNTAGDGYPLTVLVQESRTGRLLVGNYSDLIPAALTDPVRA